MRAAAEYIAARIPGARLYGVEGKGHNLMFLATEEFCDVLKLLVRTGEVNVRTYAAAGEAVEARGGPQAPCRR